MNGPGERPTPGIPGQDKNSVPSGAIRSSLSRARRGLYIALGCLMVGIGAIGIFLPILPTTEFWIAAAWFFARSSPRLEARILAHPKFGPFVRDWQDHGIMPRHAKWMAWCGTAFGYGSFFLMARPSLPLASFVALFMLTGATWIACRPEKAPLPATRRAVCMRRSRPD